MSDLISRQAAIQAIDDLPNCYNGFSDTYDKAQIIGALEELPSAEPEQKRGKWLNAEHAPNYLCYCTCSVCGKRQTIESANYCPNCGARMDMERE